MNVSSGKKNALNIKFYYYCIDVDFSFSENSYVRQEGPGATIPTKIAKSIDVLLANPVWFVVAPLTIDQALQRSVIDSYDMDNLNSPTRASKLKLAIENYLECFCT